MLFFAHRLPNNAQDKHSAPAAVDASATSAATSSGSLAEYAQEVFLSAGDDFSAATTALSHRGHLVLSSAFQKGFLLCPIPQGVY